MVKVLPGTDDTLIQFLGLPQIFLCGIRWVTYSLYASVSDMQNGDNHTLPSQTSIATTGMVKI